MVIPGLGDALILMVIFGGVSGTIGAAGWARAERIRAQRSTEKHAGTPNDSRVDNNPVLDELQALKQQIAEMHNTSHQFDISFDDALSRLEGRVNRLETKAVVSGTVTTEAGQTLRNGHMP
jgi:hypothetical protein